MAIEVENGGDGDSDNEKASEFSEEIVGVVAVGETVVEAPEKSAGEGDFDVLPGGFVDGGEETDGAVMMRPFIEEVGESTNDADKNDTEPKVENIVHDYIIPFVVYFGVEYGIIDGGSVAEWLKAHDSKSCRRATVSKVRILSLPPFAQVWCKCTDSFFESNPFASAIFLCYN